MRDRERGVRGRRLLWAVAAFGILTASASALDAMDTAAVRSVIERQLDAFRRDDAQAAYDFAAPNIRTIFPDKDHFMDMVRRGYAPVYRPRSYDFGATREEAAGGEVEMAVRIQDQGGVDWDAVYTMERQPDGSWRIAGCRLVRRPAEAV